MVKPWHVHDDSGNPWALLSEHLKQEILEETEVDFWKEIILRNNSLTGTTGIIPNNLVLYW